MELHTVLSRQGATVMRYSHMGLWDRTAKHGEITGSGVNFESAMRKFKKRQLTESQPGKWRKAPAKWKKNNGSKIDPEWYIIDYGQDG